LAVKFGPTWQDTTMIAGIGPNAQITDDEFAGLVSGNERMFALCQRAEEYANDLKSRVATVATDLRHMVAAGTINEPLAVMRVADHLDYLAHELETEIGRTPRVEVPRGKRRRPDNVTFLKY
jgi:hypothetical protein